VPRKSIAVDATEELIEELERPLAVREPNRPDIGDIVRYVMHDGVTERPLLVTAFYERQLGAERLMFISGQVFVDGSNDDGPAVRGPAAMSTLQDYVQDVPYDDGGNDGFAARTWHWRQEPTSH